MSDVTLRPSILKKQALRSPEGGRSVLWGPRAQCPPGSGRAASLGHRVKGMSPQNQGSFEQSQSWLLGCCSWREVRKIK